MQKNVYKIASKNDSRNWVWCTINKIYLMIILLATVGGVCGGEFINSWQSEYSGSEANTLTLWNFNQNDIVYGNPTYAKDVSIPLDSGKNVNIRSSAASFGPGGKFGWGLGISRTTTSNTADVDNFSFGSNSSLSVEMWVKFNSTAHITQYLLDKQFNDNSGFKFYLNRTGPAGTDIYQMVWSVGDGSAQIQVTVDANWVIGQFYHIAGTWDATTYTAKIYRDGIMIGSTISPDSVFVSGTRKIRIGQRLGSPYNSLDGIIDGLRISSIAYEYGRLCGDPGTILPGDLSGRFGFPDCNVNNYDFSVFVSNFSYSFTNDTVQFFRVAPNTAQMYDPCDIYPNGRKLLASMYGVFAPDLQRQKSDGYTMVGPYYYDQSTAISYAQSAGLTLFYGIGDQSLYGQWDNPEFVAPTQQQTVALVTDQINSVVDSPHNHLVEGWYVHPEELRYWRSIEMDYLAWVCNTARAVDPQNRPVWMYEPTHYTADNLESTQQKIEDRGAQYFDITAKGMYTNYAGHKNSRIWCRWSMEQELNMIQSLGSDALPIAIPEMFQDPNIDEYNLIPTWARHDTYLALVSGAKGIIVYSGWRRPEFSQFQNYYDAYAKIITELNGSLNLGQVFLFGEKRDDIQFLVTSGPSTVSLQVYGIPDALTYDSVSSFVAAYGTNCIGSDIYLFLVNSANSAVTVSASGLPSQTICVENVFDGTISHSIGTQLTIALNPLEVKCLRFRPYMVGDLSGPAGYPDCQVNFLDLEIIANHWLMRSNI